MAICSCSHLSHVVEIPMGDGLLRREFPQLIQEDVKLEFGAEVAQAAVAEGFQGAVGDQGAHEIHILDGKFCTNSTRQNLVTLFLP